MMQRNAALKILNPLLGILLVNQLLTGFFADRLSPQAFEILHEGGGIALAVTVLLHVALNWNWVKASYFRRTSGDRP